MTENTSFRNDLTAWRKRNVARLPGPIKNRLYDLKDLYLFKTGAVTGTPPIMKERTVRDYARRFELTTLIETGTYQGNMVEASLRTFDKIYSIELDEALWAAAQKKFAQQSHVRLLQGDSAHLLPEILQQLREPALFWLDAHYSGGETARGEQDTPVSAELMSILSHPIPEHVILIDDARCFTGRDGYPTIDSLEAMVNSHKPSCVLQIDSDIIRIHHGKNRNLP